MSRAPRPGRACAAGQGRRACRNSNTHLQRLEFSRCSRTATLDGVLDQLLAFLPVVALLCLVPGANNLLVLRTRPPRPAPAPPVRPRSAPASGSSPGRRPPPSASGGAVASVPGGLDTVGLAGSLAMVGMGLWALVPRAGVEARRSSRGFATGLAVCLANPRTPVMAVSLLPQYAVADAAATSTVALGTHLGGDRDAVEPRVRRRAPGAGSTGSRGRVVQRCGGLVVAGLACPGRALRRGSRGARSSASEERSLSSAASLIASVASVTTYPCSPRVARYWPTMLAPCSAR